MWLILTQIDSEIFIQPFGVSPGNKDSGCHISLVLSKGELRPCKPQPASVFLEKMKLNHFHPLAQKLWRLGIKMGGSSHPMHWFNFKGSCSNSVACKSGPRMFTNCTHINTYSSQSFKMVFISLNQVSMTLMRCVGSVYIQTKTFKKMVPKPSLGKPLFEM